METYAKLHKARVEEGPCGALRTSQEERNALSFNEQGYIAAMWRKKRIMKKYLVKIEDHKILFLKNIKVTEQENYLECL